MMIRKFFAVLALAAALCAPARAQFADQATWAGTGAGTANAQTITLSNASAYADVLGVVVKFTPNATNTGSTTLTINSFGSSPQIKKANGSGLVSLTGGEIVAGQPTAVLYDGTEFVLLSPLSLPVAAGGLQNSAMGFNAPNNLQINATVSSNQLTISLKTSAGTDATAANPIPIAFRDATIANGGPVWVNVTGAISFTIASSNTMGCVNATMCRLWVFAANNSGTIALCAFNARISSNPSVVGLDEAILWSSASGTTGGSQGQILYCNASSLSSKAIRYLGYIDIQETTAGTWATGPTYTQLLGPGVHKPGEVIQHLQYQTTSSTASSGATPTATGVTGAITPLSAANVVAVTAYAVAVSDVTTNPICFFQSYRNGTTAIGSRASFGLNGTGIGPQSTVIANAIDTPATTSSVTYTAFIWSSGAFNCSLVGYPQTLDLVEIMG